MAAMPERLREAMAARGLTVPALAQASKLPERYIRRYRNQETDPKIRHLIALADALEVSIDWLVGREPAVLSPEAGAALGELGARNEGLAADQHKDEGQPRRRKTDGPGQQGHAA